MRIEVLTSSCPQAAQIMVKIRDPKLNRKNIHGRQKIIQAILRKKPWSSPI
jgi:hypothetical protein